MSRRNGRQSLDDRPLSFVKLHNARQCARGVRSSSESQACTQLLVFCIFMFWLFAVRSSTLYIVFIQNCAFMAKCVQCRIGQAYSKLLVCCTSFNYIFMFLSFVCYIYCFVFLANCVFIAKCVFTKHNARCHMIIRGLCVQLLVLL